jgi:hypothetical protein
MKNLLKKLIPSHEFLLWLIPTTGAIIFAGAGANYDSWGPWIGVVILVATSIGHKEYLKKWFVERRLIEPPTIREVVYQDLGDQIRNVLDEETSFGTHQNVDKVTDKIVAIVKREL